MQVSAVLNDLDDGGFVARTVETMTAGTVALRVTRAIAERG